MNLKFRNGSFMVNKSNLQSKFIQIYIHKKVYEEYKLVNTTFCGVIVELDKKTHKNVNFEVEHSS